MWKAMHTPPHLPPVCSAVLQSQAVENGKQSSSRGMRDIQLAVSHLYLGRMRKDHVS